MKMWVTCRLNSSTNFARAIAMGNLQWGYCVALYAMPEDSSRSVELLVFKNQQRDALSLTRHGLEAMQCVSFPSSRCPKQRAFVSTCYARLKRTEWDMTNAREEIEVVIAGGGPTGLMLACELALAGVRTVVLERLLERPGFCRGFNLNARSLELLDRRGLVERFLTEGWRVPVTGFAGLEAPLSLAELASDHRYTLGIPQTRTEELIEQNGRPSLVCRSGAGTR
jgi:FAD binding domain